MVASRKISRGYQHQRVVMASCLREHLNYEVEMVLGLGERARHILDKHLPLVPQPTPGPVSKAVVLRLIHLSTIHGAQYGKQHLVQLPVLPSKIFSSLQASFHLILLWNDRH